VELVRTRFDRSIDHSPARASELRAEVTGLNFEFLDRVRWRQIGVGRAVQKIDGIVVVVNSVQHVIVVNGSQAVCYEAASGIQASSRIQLGYACAQLRQERIIAAI